MFEWLSKIINWIVNLWTSLPDETKDKIINSIVDTFEEFLRALYQASKKNAEKNTEV